MLNKITKKLTNLHVATLYTAVAVLAIVLLWGAVIYKIAADKRQAISAVHNDLQNVVIGLKEHSQDSFNAADEALRLLKFHYEDRGTQDLNLVSRYFHDRAVDIANLNQVGVIDADGIYIYSSLANHNRIDLSDREHFKVHKEMQPYPLFVSKPVIGRATGKWSFQMTRRINDKNGQFKGVAVASLNPINFLDRYSRIQLGPDSLIGLVGMDGYARTMRVGDTVRADDNLRNLVLPSSVGEATSGHFISSDFFDRTQRIFVFERLSGLPLFAIVGVREDVALQNFHHQKNSIIVIAWLLSLVIVLVAWHALHHAYVQEQLRSELTNRQNIIAQMEEAQRNNQQHTQALEHLAALGQTAEETAERAQNTVEILDISMSELDKHRNLYERLTQVYFRLKMSQISGEEFMIIANKLKPEHLLEEFTAQLNLTKRQLQQLGGHLSRLSQRP